MKICPFKCQYNIMISSIFDIGLYNIFIRIFDELYTELFVFYYDV